MLEEEEEKIFSIGDDSWCWTQTPWNTYTFCA
jgi:hypothetical protein